MRICPDCGINKNYHILNWVDGLLGSVFSFDISTKMPAWLQHSSDRWIENILIFLGFFKPVSDFKISDIPIRSKFLVEQAQQRGYSVSILKGPFEFTNFFRIRKNGKLISFEGLPVAAFMSSKSIYKIDDKDYVKKMLLRNNMPVLFGKNFSVFSQNGAVTYGEKIGYPLVVKPRHGSFARHITLDIQNKEELKKAIKKAIVYSPSFLVEKYLKNADVIRATVVDFEKIALVKRVNPNVIGDGVSSIEKLVTIKNSDPDRGEPDDETKVVFKIDKNYKTSPDYVPPKNEIVYLFEEPFIRLGADLEDVTVVTHPDNVELFKRVAKLFDTRLVGLDFICMDISRSYKDQDCGILELNSLPCVEIHQEPTTGSPVNVSGWLLDMMEKYY